MSALTLRLMPCASSSRDRSRKTWFATWASGARTPPEVASWAISTVVCRTIESRRMLTVIGLGFDLATMAQSSATGECHDGHPPAGMRALPDPEPGYAARRWSAEDSREATAPG